MSDIEKLNSLVHMSEAASPENIGDIYPAAVEVANSIDDPILGAKGDEIVHRIRKIARDADTGWRISVSPVEIERPLSNLEAIQLITMVSMLHSFCYGVERLDEASEVTGPSSPPVQFYINSLYHYIASLYLLDKSSDPMGGTAYKTLEPLDLAHLLEPIRLLLDKPVSPDITFGETIRQIRNRFLVHGKFSPDDIADVVQDSRLHDMSQKFKITDLIWQLFEESLILKLNILSLLTSQKIDPMTVVRQYMQSQDG